MSTHFHLPRVFFEKPISVYLAGPDYTGPTLTPASPTQAFIGVIFQMLTVKLKQTYNSGPFNAISREIMPFRAGVIRANKVFGSHSSN